MAKSRKGKPKASRVRKNAAKAKKFKAAAHKRRSLIAAKKPLKKGKKATPAPVVKLNPKLAKRAEEQNKKAEGLMTRGRARGFVTNDEIL